MLMQFITGLLGAAAGSIVTFFTIRHQVRREHAAQAYADFCSDVAALSFASSEEDIHDAEQQLAATMARAAIYGKKTVVERIAEFIPDNREDEVADDLATRDELDTRVAEATRVVEAMREHIHGCRKGKVSESLGKIIQG